MFSEMLKILRYRITGLIPVIFLLFCSAGAATKAGELILTQPVSIWSDALFITSANVPVTISVDPIYGVAVSPDTENLITVNSAVSIQKARTIFNLGNTSDQVAVSVAPSTASWSVRYYLDEDGDGIRQPSENEEIVFPEIMPAESSLNIIIQYDPAIPVSCIIPMSISTLGTPNGEYTGFNGFSYGGAGQRNVTDNIIYISENFVLIQLRALLQGYYSPEQDSSVTASVVIELRTVRNVSAIQHQTSLNAQGWTEIITCNGNAPDEYYVYLKHGNHFGVVSAEKLFLTQDLTVLDFSDSNSAYFQPVYFSSNSAVAAQTLRIEKNGLMTIRGGDVTGDQLSSLADWVVWNHEWFYQDGLMSDFNGDGLIDTRDFGIWLSNNQVYLPID